jgi:hypothetical protein
MKATRLSGVLTFASICFIISGCVSSSSRPDSSFLTIAKDSLYDVEVRNSTACPAEVLLSENNGLGKNLVTVPARTTQVVVVRSTIGGTISAIALTPTRSPCDGMLRQPIYLRSIRTLPAE